jgi:hypothetical protein
LHTSYTPKDRLVIEKRYLNLINLNSGALSQTYRIGEVWMGSAFFGVYLHQLKIIPYSRDEMVEATRKTVVDEGL